MSNPLYDSLANNDIIKQFQQFKQNFKGDPKAQIQQMLNSGRITQNQYNQAVQKAQMLRNMLGIK